MMCDLNEKLDTLLDLKKEIQKHHKKLSQEQSIIDKEIVDIEHYIEFYNFNAAQGYKAYKMLQERFIRRREIKNEMQKCSMIWNSRVNNISEKQFDSVENKKYKARILKELFNN